METSILGGGCFWCTEAVFERVEGVKEVISGYAGGDILNPTYKQICTGTTGHAEVIKIIYDPQGYSMRKYYRFLLNVMTQLLKQAGCRCWDSIPFNHNVSF